MRKAMAAIRKSALGGEARRKAREEQKQPEAITLKKSKESSAPPGRTRGRAAVASATGRYFTTQGSGSAGADLGNLVRSSRKRIFHR